jgi:predicted CopG family antitoxin
MVEYTYIRVSKETAEKLKKLGKKGETYEDVILRLIEEVEKK